VLFCCLRADQNRLTRVDAATGILHELLFWKNESPRGVLAGSGDMVYFTDLKTGALHTYNVASHELKNITVLDSSVPDGNRSMVGLAIHPTTGLLYVAAGQMPATGIYRVDLTEATAPSKVCNVAPVDPVGGWDDGTIQYLAFNRSGPGSELFFTAYRNKTIYKWDTIVGHAAVALNAQCSSDNSCQGALDGRLISEVQFGVYGIAFDSVGNMFVSEAAGSKVWFVEVGTGKLKLVAGLGGGYGSAIDPGNATNSQFTFIRGVALGPGATSLFFADQLNHRIVRVLLECTMV
jgi:hypothetical protein